MADGDGAGKLSTSQAITSDWIQRMCRRVQLRSHRRSWQLEQGFTKNKQPLTFLLAAVVKETQSLPSNIHALYCCIFMLQPIAGGDSPLHWQLSGQLNIIQVFCSTQKDGI